MAVYNRTRAVEQLLEKTESSPPSFTVHLHPEYWILNNGLKFLYQNPLACLLEDVRAHRIPVDFMQHFDMARAPYYDGCMIVELLDYRPQKSKEPPPPTPLKTRVVLHPNPETLWGDICYLNQQRGGKWTDRDALEVEAKILLATTQPLCLDPDPHLTRIVNHVLRVSTPSMPLSLKRKAANMEPEEDGPEKAKRERLLTFMAPRGTMGHTPNYRLLETLAAHKVRTKTPVPVPPNQFMVAPPQPPQVASMQMHQISPVDSQVQHQQSATPTPVSMMQPQVYPSVQAATEAANRAATPLQQQTLQPQQYQQYQQPYLQQPQFQYQQQQQQHSQQLQPPRPVSQPQRSPQTPQQPTPQQLQLLQQAPHRFTQSPKPILQPISSTPSRAQPTPQPYSGSPQFQTPNSQFQQQPIPSVRAIQKPQQLTSGLQPQQQANIRAQTPAPSSTIHQAQMMYSQQMHQSQQQLQANLLIQQQRMSMSAAAQKNAGRATPQVPQNLSNQGQPRSSTPSPVKASPLAMQQHLAAAAVSRSSPMPAKAQLAPQGQQQTPQQQLAIRQGGIPVPVAFPQQYPSQLRSMAPPQSHMMLNQGAVNVNGTPIMSGGSPPMNGRPITPALLGPDGKPQQQQQGMQGPAQQPIRRPTPLQQQQQQQQPQHQQQLRNAVSPQAPQLSHAAQVQALQHQVSQHQHQQQNQQQQQQAHSSQQQPTQVSQSQVAHYPSVYGYSPYPLTAAGYWRSVPGVPQVPQGATPAQQQQFQQLLQQRMAQQVVSGGQSIMTANAQAQQQQVQQQQQQQLQLQQQQQQQQKMANIHQQQQQAAAAQAAQQVLLMGGQQQAQAQMMMNKMHSQPSPMQAQSPQTQAQAQQPAAPVAKGQGKGKGGAKKGAAGKKTGGVQR